MSGRVYFGVIEFHFFTERKNRSLRESIAAHGALVISIQLMPLKSMSGRDNFLLKNAGELKELVGVMGNLKRSYLHD